MAQGVEALVVRKSKRPYKPKVRTGCITCKCVLLCYAVVLRDVYAKYKARIRRVKCNEDKPACFQCTSTGRSCDGYEPPRPLLFEVSKDQAERRSFQYFRERTAPELQCDKTVCSGSPFWDGFVLRASYHQQVVRHAAAAIGSFHESLDLGPGSQALTARGFAFEQYNKAISVLTKSNGSLPTEDVLVACILFTWFENLQGSFAISLDHLKNGVKILEAWRSKSISKTNAGASVATIDDHLGPMLDRLKLQADVFLNSVDRGELPQPSSNLPKEFLSLSQAHHRFYQIIHWTCHELEIGLKKQSLEYVETELIPVISSKLNQWYDLLEQYLDGGSKDAEINEELDPHWRIKSELHLRIQYHQAMLMLHAFPYDLETRFDGQLEHFRSIVSLSQRFLDEMDAEAGAGDSLELDVAYGAFEHDHAIIPSLFLTACRCRDPVIRREAIAIMRRRRWREDIWDSAISAHIAEYLMLLEETGLGDVKSCHDIPDFSRLYLVGATFFAYNSEGYQLQLSVFENQRPLRTKRELIKARKYNTIDREWTTVGAKLHCFRSGSDIIADGVEDFWWSYGGNAAPVDPEQIFFRDVGGGLFPQLAKSNGKRLWSILNRGNAIRCMGRFGSPSICLYSPINIVEVWPAKNPDAVRAHARSTGASGDIITLVGQFSEYMATDRPWAGLGSVPASP